MSPSAAAAPPLRPRWIKGRAPAGEHYESVLRLMRELRLHTVCEEAHCPNLGECWGRGTATFMILGDVCTRACAFCAVKTGLPPLPPDPSEPTRVADAVKRMRLRHAVITSVDRDELPDGGAGAFARTIAAIRQQAPLCSIEVLIPDFKGDAEALAKVIEAEPDVLNHNVETVPRLYRRVRPGANFARSLELLGRSRQAGLLTKSGIMVGLGEERSEVDETILAIREAGTEILTVGQYLRPSPRHAPLIRYYPPEEFEEIRRLAEAAGFLHVESGPLVRSSYHAEQHLPARGSASALVTPPTTDRGASPSAVDKSLAGPE